jgi:hypothetical protein
MGFCASFQRFILGRINLLFIVGFWLLARNNSLQLSCFNSSLHLGGLQERRIIEAAKVPQAKTT